MTIQNGVGFKTLLAEANADVETITIETLQKTIDDDTIVVIDLRDIREDGYAIGDDGLLVNRATGAGGRTPG